MPDSAEVAAEEIAQAIDGGIDVFEDKKSGEVHVALETDDQSVSGYGHSREQAFADLIKQAKAVGWGL